MKLLPKQCPFRTTKYLCKEADWCTSDILSNNGMPHEWNECSIARRQSNGNPWKNERKVVWVEKMAQYVALEGKQE